MISIYDATQWLYLKVQRYQLRNYSNLVLRNGLRNHANVVLRNVSVQSYYVINNVIILIPQFDPQV